MAVGEAFLSAFLQVLFDRLASKHLFDLIRGGDTETVLKRLRKTLMLVKTVLNDAEEKQGRDEAVQMWLDELKDVVYDAEDVIDEFSTEASQWKLEHELESSKSLVWNLISTSLNPSGFLFDVRIESKIEEISERLDDLAKQRLELGLKEVAAESYTKVRESSSVMDESRVFGRDHDKEKIINLLLGMEDEVGYDHKVTVIPVVGMGGVGKTTLAQIVYNNSSVKDHFDVRAWVCVSDDFEVKKITKAILESITFKACAFNDLDAVQFELKVALTGKKFLIVLDDVWTKKYGEWDDLQNPLRAGAPGSKIIVTTRNTDVALMMGNVPYHNLELLSNDSCWLVFVQHAFGHRNIDGLPNLKRVGEKIVEKCKGLPLAAKTLGGLLRCKLKDDEWEDVLNSRLWDLPDEENDILPALRISYHHLPSHLKRCFAYCSILPKDYEFGEKELILLWMAEGFLPERGKKQMEDVGAEYFHDLLSRSFFQQSNNDKSRFVMHDLINDLAQWVAGDICFRLEDQLLGDRQSKIFQKARHSSYIAGRHDGMKKFESYYHLKKLRTFLPFKLLNTGYYYIANEIPFNLLPMFGCLRVLSMSGYGISELPDSIGKLKLLRYIDLSGTRIRRLPRSISALYNLQTLILTECWLIELPMDLEKLVNLRHLEITNVNNLKEMPAHIGKLKNLRTLSYFVVGKGTGSRISELKNSVHLREKLHISRLDNVVDSQDALDANLSNKPELNMLMMEWGSEFDDDRNANLEKEVLDMLQPHKDLKQLTIKYYGGESFPTWMGNPAFSSLASLNFSDCANCTHLPPIGQLPSLRELCIKRMKCIRSVDSNFYGDGWSCSVPFPSLEKLRFEDMEEWQEWFSSNNEREFKAFTCLSDLQIINCPKLLGQLPAHLPSLKTLVVQECDKMVILIRSLLSLNVLNIEQCAEVVFEDAAELTSLTFLRISDVPKLNCPVNLPTLPFLRDLSLQRRADILLRNPGMNTFRSLNSLLLCDIPDFNCLPKIFMRQMAKDEDHFPGDKLSFLSQGQAEPEAEKNLSSLHHLVIQGCPKLHSMVVEENKDMQMQVLPVTLVSLELRLCYSLMKIPKQLNTLSSLQKLTIQGCPKLKCIPETNFPSTLRTLHIEGCRSLQLLPEKTMYDSSIEDLHISHCPSLMFISRAQLPGTLKILNIYSCSNLQFLLYEEGSTSFMMQINDDSLSLEYLYISSCSSLASLSSRGELPPTLKHLHVVACPKLRAVAERMHHNSSLEHIIVCSCEMLDLLPEDLHSLRHLSCISIYRCPNLITFPRVLPSSLKEVSISTCQKLSNLPSMANLTSLQHLCIASCPAIISFPNRGFPVTLSSLRICHLSNLDRLPSEWELQRLIFLKALKISGCCKLRSFLDKELPSSLTSLYIEDFPSLQCLSSTAFQKMTSLEYLYICNCPELVSFPEEGLPFSLLHLQICRCPQLKRRCRKDIGEEWPKIAHIPEVISREMFIIEPQKA